MKIEGAFNVHRNTYGEFMYEKKIILVFSLHNHNGEFMNLAVKKCCILHPVFNVLIKI